ncbi:hypothetical protein BCV69DRAFT_312812 [Microstroma glucosiphilum]|uniref:C3H1-type domain-containing protein n=1 Tax=Pseudomicrostroma glucosiphilum TaxID=1684307 RepID=A0A316U4L8_9BASI|nr:hypothetical protein BCV69DRAFT_312812 [Pseudomicrostroma glucosiphilum]PWN20202.1 hypothetical protein BCV69DRAFT_312812 [Pseudomicrostroma glucosiphilum]
MTETDRPKQPMASPAGAHGSGGSTLANTKLTKRQTEALGRVPCKFFRSAGGCSAGEACPFAHIPAGAGAGSNDGGSGADAAGGKAVCEYFLKGNCRYGAKCLLAHVREGEPLSMDRKNKRGAQAGARTASNGQHQGPVHQQQPPFYRGNSSRITGQHEQPSHPHDLRLAQPSSSNVHSSLQRSIPVPSLPHIHHTSAQSSMPFAPSRIDDFAFGLPDDLGPAAPPFGAALPPPLSQDLSSRNVSFSPGFVGSPPTAGPFGSSPFSNGQSVFFSSSQDADRVGIRSLMRPSSYTPGGAMSEQTSYLGIPQSSSSRSLTAQDHSIRGRLYAGHEELDLDEDGHNEEDFLPSSLSDLLTPAELERRRRNVEATADGRPEQDTSVHQSPSRAVWGSAQAGRSTPFDGQELLGRSDSQRLTAGADSSGGISSSPSRGHLANVSAPSSVSVGNKAWTPTPQQRINSRSDVKVGFDRFQDLRSQASISHAPGQSLPRGLAAGLSRLHLTSPERSQGDSGVSQVSARPPEGSAPPGRDQTLSPSQRSTPSHAGFGPIGSLRNNASSPLSQGPDSTLDVHDLGPTAPSSLLPHRAPGGFQSRFDFSSERSSVDSSDKKGGEVSDSSRPGREALSNGLTSSSSSARAGKTSSSSPSGLAASGSPSALGTLRTWTTGEQSGMKKGSGTGAITSTLSFGATTSPAFVGAGSSDQEHGRRGEEDGEEVGVFELE